MPEVVIERGGVEGKGAKVWTGEGNRKGTRCEQRGDCT